MNKRILLQQNLDLFELSLLSKENMREKSEYNNYCAIRFLMVMIVGCCKNLYSLVTGIEFSHTGGKFFLPCKVAVKVGCQIDLLKLYAYKRLRWR